VAQGCAAAVRGRAGPGQIGLGLGELQYRTIGRFFPGVQYKILGRLGQGKGHYTHGVRAQYMRTPCAIMLWKHTPLAVQC
jgi:hypothetical protein